MVLLIQIEIAKVSFIFLCFIFLFHNLFQINKSIYKKNVMKRAQNVMDQMEINVYHAQVAPFY